MWLNGRDLRQKPLLERKRLLRGLMPERPSSFAVHEPSGQRRDSFFELVCEQNLEGIICKPKTSPYPFTWIKVRNPNYTHAAERGEWFNRIRK